MKQSKRQAEEALAKGRLKQEPSTDNMCRLRLRIHQKDALPMMLDDLRISDEDSKLQKKEQRPLAADLRDSGGHREHQKRVRTMDFMGIVLTFAIPEQFIGTKDHTMEDDNVLSDIEQQNRHMWSCLDGRVSTKDSKTLRAISEFLCECRFEKLELCSQSLEQELVAISDKAWLAVLLANEAGEKDGFALFYFVKYFDHHDDSNGVRFMVLQLDLENLAESAVTPGAKSRGADVAKDLQRRAQSLKDRDCLVTKSLHTDPLTISRPDTTDSMPKSKRAVLQPMAQPTAQPMGQQIYRKRLPVSRKTIETMVHAALRLRDGLESGAGSYSNADYAELWGNTVRTVEFIYERHQKKRASKARAADGTSPSYPEADIDALRGWVERCLELFGE